MICKQKAILGCTKFHTFKKNVKENSKEPISSPTKRDEISIKLSWGPFTISSLGWTSELSSCEPWKWKSFNKIGI